MKLNTLKKHQVKVLAAATGFAMAALLAGPAKAASPVSTTFKVNITIQNTCDISTAPADIDFGTHLSSDTVPVGSTSLSLTCTKGAAYDIGLLPSGGDSTGSGTMTSGSNSIAYTLWQDSGASTTKWGNTIGSNTLHGTGDGTAHTIPVYAKVASISTAPAGTYSDTVTVTVTY